MSIQSQFDRFWFHYPRKQGKADARKAFKKLKPDDALVDNMISAVQRAAKSRQWQEAQYIPLPGTWIRGERWEDVILDSEFDGNRVWQATVEREQAIQKAKQAEMEAIERDPDFAHSQVKEFLAKCGDKGMPDNKVDEEERRRFLREQGEGM